MPTLTPRLSLPKPLNTEAPQGNAQIGALADALDSVAPISHGTLASRPVSTVGTPGIVGRFYYADDTAELWYDTGTGWLAIPGTNSIGDSKMKVKTIWSAILGANTGLLAVSPTWTTVIDLAVTTTGVQTLAVCVNARFRNEHATNKPNLCLRVIDVTAASATIYKDPGGDQFGTAGGGADAKNMIRAFRYNTPSGGARTLRLQASADFGGSMRGTANVTFAGDAFASPTIEACII